MRIKHETVQTLDHNQMSRHVISEMSSGILWDLSLNLFSQVHPELSDEHWQTCPSVGTVVEQPLHDAVGLNVFLCMSLMTWLKNPKIILPQTLAVFFELFRCLCCRSTSSVVWMRETWQTTPHLWSPASFSALNSQSWPHRRRQAWSMGRALSRYMLLPLSLFPWNFRPITAF